MKECLFVFKVKGRGMQNDSWYDSFLESLAEKYPQKSQLTEALMDLLSIEKEAVYRRLRKDVVFPVHEVVKIAQTWHISLDDLTGVHAAKTYPFRLHLHRYIDPSQEDVKSLQHFVDFIDTICCSNDAEYMEVSNTLPRSLFTGYPYLSRYYIFKWMYQYGDDEKVYPFSQVLPSERIRLLGTEYHNKIKKIANVNYIWDHLILDYLINDIQYFSSIYLISEEEIQLIKNDLYALLDYMAEVSAKGCFPETKNNVNLYISQLNIDTGYSYFYSDEIKISRIRAFLKHEISTTDVEMIENFRTWMYLKKRSSIQISGVDEKRRIEFFIKQRELIDTL
jgi:hypothetical protein